MILRQRRSFHLQRDPGVPLLRDTQVRRQIHSRAPLRHRATEVQAQRAATLDAAYAANPARFRHHRPTPPKLPTVAWINQPTPEALIKSE